MARRDVEFQQAPGATPLDDLSGLKQDWISTQSQLDHAEAESIRLARRRFLDRSIPHPRGWFHTLFLRKMHASMFGPVWDWAGKFRMTQTNIGHAPHQIALSLQELCNDVIYWLEAQALPPLEQAARIHHRLVAIHPFPNGNGRFARLVADRFLKFCGGRLPEWPSHLPNPTEVRLRYIAALKAADQGDYTPLLDSMRHYGASMI